MLSKTFTAPPEPDGFQSFLCSSSFSISNGISIPLAPQKSMKLFRASLPGVKERRQMAKNGTLHTPHLQ
jgi:hypothetical protein